MKAVKPQAQSSGVPVLHEGESASMSVEEYLRTEPTAPIRREFDRGIAQAMSGGSPEHSLVKTELVYLLASGLRDGNCTLFDSDMRVQVADDQFVYPDASVVCDPPEYTGEGAMRSLANPLVVIEVLSASSEGYDRGDKFRKYFSMKSVRDYILVSQERPRVEVISQNEDGEHYQLRVFDGLDRTAVIPSLSFQIQLAEIYRTLSFSTDDD